MKNIILIIAAIFICSPAIAQLTLAHSYSMTDAAQVEIVNLTRSGKKIMTTNFTGRRGPDTLFFYNMDYSFWKMIACPLVPGKATRVNLYDYGLGLGGVTVYYPSEMLFNTDTFLEVAMLYSSSSTITHTLYIVNEYSIIVDSIPNLAWNNHIPQVYESASGVFKLAVPVVSGINVYDLPGTIPCNPCGRRLGYAGEPQKSEDIPSRPIPNPSANEVKITFELPKGVTMATLKLYTSDGRLVNSYNVDNRFGFIVLDNSVLPAGLYYYNIEANGNVSSTQKLLVVK